MSLSCLAGLTIILLAILIIYLEPGSCETDSKCSQLNTKVPADDYQSIVTSDGKKRITFMGFFSFKTSSIGYLAPKLMDAQWSIISGGIHSLSLDFDCANIEILIDDQVKHVQMHTNFRYPLLGGQDKCSIRDVKLDSSGNSIHNGFLNCLPKYPVNTSCRLSLYNFSFVDIERWSFEKRLMDLHDSVK